MNMLLFYRDRVFKCDALLIMYCRGHSNPYSFHFFEFTALFVMSNFFVRIQQVWANHETPNKYKLH